MGLNQSEECFFLVDPEFHNVQYRYSTNFATSIISGIFSPVAVTANFVVLYVIFRAAWLRDPSNLLLACLAACDMLIGVIVQPSYVSFRLSENRDHFVPCFVRIIYSTSFFICYGVSFLTLNSISCERYIALTIHLRYKAIVTKRRLLLVAAVIWVLNASLTCLQFAGINDIVRTIHLTIWFVCLFTSGLLQFKIVGIVRKHHDQIRRQEHQFNLNANSYRRQLKLATSIAYIVGIYIFLNLPVLVVTTYHQIVRGNLSTLNYYSWAETVALLNSSLNPFICCWRSRNIRKAIFKLVATWITCKTSSKGGDEDVVHNGVKNSRKYEFGCHLNMKPLRL
ncbi:adenosine receptor A2b-like [Pocillopora verrucosa]|uniref:adenosine receptor A2b-like n=1 Tax=Pocillopora verrucosa TaxID=203993 RepID=UPI0027977EE1|nr:adenosine receptor A2b-like [Pocillopora verrucosa]